jgi:hypothetical protein
VTRHPLHCLASLDARARIRAAVDDCCVPSLDPERVTDCITGAVLAVRVPDLNHDLHARARRIAGQTKRDGLVTEGA